MTHDAMWFVHCVEACGIDTANRINRAAVRSMAAVEVRRIQQALGLPAVRTPRDLAALLEGAVDLVKADFMDFTWSCPAPDRVRWEMRRCFAYEGVRKLGLLDRYQCGIFERIAGWLDGLGLAHEMTPPVTGCMLHAEGVCFREFQVRFAPGDGP
jgi:hypothetical protein